jgi:transcriptional regulator NrdR family protein
VKFHLAIKFDDQKNLDNIKSKNQFATRDENKDKNLRDIIKRFAVYELYKFITPQRIAGESRQANFTHNMLVSGLKRALNYVDNKAQALERQNSSLIHINTKSNGMSL